MYFFFGYLIYNLTACVANQVDKPNAQDDSVEIAFPQLSDVDQLITEEMTAAGVPGLSACLIARTDILWCNGYGYANIESDLLVKPSTPFMLASVSKTVVATAVMQLQDRGLLDIDEPINTVLNFTVVHPQDTTPITTRMLLSHVAGINDNWSIMNDLIVEGDSPIQLGEFLEDYLTSGGQYYNENSNFVSQGVVQKKMYSNIGIALAA